MAILPSIWSPILTTTDNIDKFWTSDFHIKNQIVWHYDSLKGAELYKKQQEDLASAILVDDYSPIIKVDEYDVTFQTKYRWPNKGELISGSFMARTAVRTRFNHKDLKADDVDIYFKCKTDAKEFATINNCLGFSFNSDVCSYSEESGFKINLIYGIEYESPANLISRFDIRACSMCLDPNTNKFYSVRGSMMDVMNKDIVFNSVPRGVSVRRLIKYTDKGFSIDKHQRLFFSELIRSDIYSPELELHTKDY